MSEIKPCPEITQADRDATAKVLGYQCWADATDYRLTGQQDRQVEKFVQAFARHRSDACATVQRERDEVREALETALRLMHTTRHIAIIAHGHWDNDEDSKVGKLLLALSGMLPKYRPDIDEIHAFLARYEASK